MKLLATITDPFDIVNKQYVDNVQTDLNGRLTTVYVAVDTANTTANQALSAATAATNAISKLEGLADADTSAITTAEVVMQVETNKQDIITLNEKFVILTQEQYDSLPVIDTTKLYFITEAA